MAEYSEYKLYCETEAATKTLFALSAPTVCPTNAAHTVRSGSVYVSKATVPGQTYYEEAATALDEGDVVGLLPGNKVSKGFGLPTKYLFEGKSAAFTASAMVGARLVICWTGTLSQPTANNGFVVSAAPTVGPFGMTYGTPVCFSGVANVATTSIAICALSSTDFVIVYRGVSNQAMCVFGAVAGVVVTVGTPTVLNATSTGDQIGSIWVGLVGASIVVAYRDAGNSNRGYWVAGTTINLGILRVVTWGLKGIFNNAATATAQYGLTGVVLDGSRFAIFFDNGTASIRVMIGSVLLVVITGGTMSAAIDSANVIGGSNMSCCKLGVIGGNIVLGLFYRRSVDNVTTGSAIVATCSSAGTLAGSQTVTVGSPVTFTDAPSMQNPSAVSLVAVGGAAGSLAVSYIDASNSNAGKIATMVVNTNGTLTPKEAGFVYNLACQYSALCVTTGTTCAVVYRDMLYFNTGSAGLFTVTGAELVVDFAETKSRLPFGISERTAAQGEIVEVSTLRPMCLTGLTPTAVYYAHGDGSCTRSNVPINGSYVPVKLGQATSAGGLIVKIN